MITKSTVELFDRRTASLSVKPAKSGAENLKSEPPNFPIGLRVGWLKKMGFKSCDFIRDQFLALG
jgi:hypothetical protein